MIAHNLHIGQKVEDFAAFESAITRCQSDENVQFYRRDSRSVDKTLPRLDIAQIYPCNILQYFTILENGYFQMKKM